MRKRIRSLLLVSALGIITLVVANCGGGGGGGGTPTSTTSTSKQVSMTVTFNTSSARVAGSRAADAAVASTSVVAYNAHTGAQLNTASVATNASGVATIVVDLGTSTSLDVIVEALTAAKGTVSNIKVAFDNLSANAGAVAANYNTTQDADIFIWQPDAALADIQKANDIMVAQGVDVLDTITTAAQAGNYLDAMAPALACDTSDSACVSTALSTQLASTDAASYDSAVVTMVTSAQEDAGWTTVQAIFADAGESVTAINTDAEKKEIVGVLESAISAWSKTYATTAEKRLTIKEVVVAAKYGNTFTSEDVSSIIANLRASLNSLVAPAAVASTTLVSSNDMSSMMNGYDILRGVLIRSMHENAGASAQTAADSINSLLDVLAALGAGSESTTSMGQVMDNWLPVWTAQTAALMTALGPLEMADHTKTDNLMQLAHDLQALPAGATDAQVEDVLNDYLSAATTAKAMTMYTDHKTCSFSTSGTSVVANNCPSKEEIFDLIETHYEKSLPKLRAFEQGIEDWYNSSDSSLDKIVLGNTYAIMQNVYASMKESSANKAAIGAALDAAGIHKELFWLVMNLEPYM